MRKYKSIDKPTLQVCEVICDMCGKIIESVIENQFEFLALHTRWGYGSSLDGEEWTAQVCQECVEEKLVPIIKFVRS